MDILSHLAELIKTRKEVGIPELGTVYKRKSPGRYDAETHSFLPPGYKIDFTTEVREHKSLVAYIARKRNISSESATYYIDQFAEEIKSQLASKQEADFGELGTLYEVTGNLRFTPKNEENFGFDFYGLPPVKDEAIPQDEIEQPIEQQSEVSEEQLTIEDSNAGLSDGSGDFDESHHEEKDIDDEQPVYEEISEVKHPAKPETTVSIETPEGTEENIEDTYTPENTLSETAPAIEAIPNSDYNDHNWNFDQVSGSQSSADSLKEARNIPVYLKILIVIFIMIAILTAAYVIKPDLFRRFAENDTRHDQPQTTSKTDNLITDSVSYTDSVNKSAERNVIPVDSDSLITATNPGLPADTVTTWEVIGASVINQKEADWFITQMKDIGITAKIIPNMPGKRRIKISVATFKDEASAKEGRKALVIKLKDPGIYIHQNKHTHKPQ